ncbi:hypothetical protein DFJ77DRAFT_287168 [Powellomyces hirtus]|nr:hypothetical protein DFJ77DRAFT_287168 [Powellomyces hirtus]
MLCFLRHTPQDSTPRCLIALLKTLATSRVNAATLVSLNDTFVFGFKRLKSDRLLTNATSRELSRQTSNISPIKPTKQLLWELWEMAALSRFLTQRESTVRHCNTVDRCPHNDRGSRSRHYRKFRQ